MQQIIVLKFGSSVLRDEKDLPSAVHEIYRWWRDGFQVIAVVSAFGDTTNELTRRAQSVCDQPHDAFVAQLLATGEAASSALLGLALNRAGIPVTVLDAERARLFTDGPTLDSQPTSIDTAGLLHVLQSSVVVLPGFVGKNRSGQTTLLGRGGSDLTALFLAQRLGAVCRLIKDVDGLYTSDPNAGPSAARFTRVSYATAARVGGAVVQRKAIDFAEHHRVRFTVSSAASSYATEIGPYVDSIAISELRAEPLRVALLGCGTVGGGVYQRLAALPEFFEVVDVGTRKTARLEELLEKPIDIVVELLGGEEPARTLISTALRLGRHVITANKALLAADVSNLETLAVKNGVSLKYSAAVGGVAPVLETIGRARSSGPLHSIAGVLNGTTNFILDHIAEGRSLSEALFIAREHGYAERDPQLDLDGTDAAQKLILLARAAFDVDLPLSSIHRRGIQNLPLNRTGHITRLVAECRRENNGFVGTVAPVELPLDHPLARVRGVENRLLIQSQTGKRWEISGNGAGRWPTTEAVLADLFNLRREVIRNETVEEQECVA
jgi:homoserine dehydrogenase